ncbi:hypothetical protein KQX54_013914 [Cotesia glomerata]|uniref:GPI ethanolamine phosphate transferase 3 n=1 Tax=Cotesia glomerata TaxID=32391 RepID=A0AAV7IXX8_COTGL|nr:hypothetical protein KQX54_013914 [Cotesia glomerata]
MVTGLILFLNGFFLTRISQVERSNCTSCKNLENYNIETLLKNPELAGEVCSEFRRRVVLLVVDALKYEFLDWQDNITNPYYQNKIPAVHHLLNKYPNNSRLYKSIVDPPSTTMQRIKAITTGTLPTFIDVSSNFASEEVDEDNLIHQIGEKGVVFMGDDTWTNLFPGKYLRQFPAHSFNTRDLDTVDREVRSRIFFELQKNDWSLLIAHNLGVDHCGHKHGPNHPEMTRKLNEINELINEIISAIDNHTVFFVIGDHGMTDTGDHGGDSDDEIEAGLFIYSKSSLQNPIEGQNRKTLNQIDIVPTLASILGIPIPFSNIGSLISDALPVVSETSDVSHTLHALWRNVYQTKKYIDTYSANSFLFTEQTLQELDQYYQNLFQQVSKVNNQEALKNFAQVAYKYLKIIRDSCIEIWVQFEWDLINNDDDDDDDDDDNTPIVYGLGTVYSAAFITLSVFITLLVALLLGRFLAPSIFLMFITCTAVLVIIGMERHQNATDFTELLQIPNSAIFCWFLIAEYFFYGTGHQPTFSTIQWDAALVGSHGFFYTNIVPTVLIGINTFGSHILLGFTLPLLVIVPATIIIMIPSLSKVQFRVNEELKKGELVLFDRLSAFHNSLFLVAGKYILLHGLRTFGCMLATTFLCRHLMVWKIFAPKLIFEGISFLVTLGSVIISYLMIYRIDNKIELLITGVNKIR